MKYNDQPIYRPDQDAFGRANFASLLAAALDRFPVSKDGVAKDGYIIAINGQWGSGKTSTIELILRRMRHLEMERASQIVLPQYQTARPCSQEELENMSRPFEEIEGRIGLIEAQNKDTTRWEPISRINEFRRWLDSEKRAEDADRYFRLRTHVAKNPRTVVVRFSPWIFSGRVELAAALLSELARTLGQTLGADVRNAFGKVLGRLAELAPLGGAGIDLVGGSGLGGILSSGSSIMRKVADRMTSGPSLDELRLQLKQALRALDERQVLIVVDDLDRLTPQEALEMVTLVKGLGDLPNVVYVLSYDEETLARLIDQAVDANNKSNYLDKIVQYSVSLPLFGRDDIANFLEKDLIEFTEKLSSSDQSRLRFVWNYVLRHYLRTPRDVRRLVNNFYFARLAIAEITDPIDLLVIETLRLFEPAIYSWVRFNIADLAD